MSLSGRVVIDEESVTRRVRGLAEEVRRELATEPGDELVIVGILTGSFVFVADLVRELARLEVPARVAFVATSLYGSGREAAPEVRLVMDLQESLHGRRVLIVDDILDSGRSLALVRARVEREEPAWLRTCVLLDKPAGRDDRITADHVGFEIPNEWVVGYGLDLAGSWRGLPWIVAHGREVEG